MRITVHPELHRSRPERQLGRDFWRQARDKIAKHPDLSKPLTRGLTGCWTVKVAQSRVVYEMVADRHARVLAAGPRSDVYERAEGRR